MIRASEVNDTNWAAHLEQCESNGTGKRILTAWKTGATVRIKRSSGEWQDCKITGWGFAGRAWNVTWGSGGDARFKRIDLGDLLQWNPWLDACEDH